MLLGVPPLVLQSQYSGRKWRFRPLYAKVSRKRYVIRSRVLLTINRNHIGYRWVAVDFFTRGIHTRTAVARLPLRLPGFLLLYCCIQIILLSHNTDNSNKLSFSTNYYDGKITTLFILFCTVPNGSLLTLKIFICCSYVDLTFIFYCIFTLFLLTATVKQHTCCIKLITDWSLYWSTRSISHCRCGSFLTARYSFTKAWGFSDVWRSANRSRHCCCGSFFSSCSARISCSPKTPSWNRKSMILAALTLSTTVECNLLHFSFNTALDTATVCMLTQKIYLQTWKLRT